MPREREGAEAGELPACLPALAADTGDPPPHGTV